MKQRLRDLSATAGLLIAIAAAPWIIEAAHASDGAATGTAETDCRKLGLERCPEPFDAEVPAAADMLRWSSAERVVGFRNTYRQYASDVFHADPRAVFALKSRPKADFRPRYRLQQHEYGLNEYLRHQAVTGLLILQHDQILYEYYAEGNTRTTLWTSRSVAKSVVSLLVGIAIRSRIIPSVDVLLTGYIPELRGTAWDGVTLKQALQHTSGVQWNENYEDPSSDFARLTRCEASANPYTCIMNLVGSLKRLPGVVPGERWSYNTGGAWLVGRVLERASGMRLGSFLEQHLWRPFGMESDGVWEALQDSDADMGGHGFNATLRDWGRLGAFVARGGRMPDGQVALPPDWLMQSTDWTRASGSIDSSNPKGQFGYQWWHLGVSPGEGSDSVRRYLDRSMAAEGIFGQTISIHPRDGLVLVQWSVWPHAEMSSSTYDEQALFLAAIAENLKHARRPAR
jgi:CubicO group peptidase (beta-lactamase class C family)